LADRKHPGVFVRLGAAQEIEFFVPLGDGAFNRMPDEQRAGAEFLEFGIETAQVIESHLVIPEPI